MIAQLVMSKGKKPKKVNTKPFDFAFGVYASSPKGIRFYCKGVHSFAKGIRRRAYPSEPQKRNIGIKTALGVKITLLRAVFAYIRGQKPCIIVSI